jgi:hypothetical protein
MKLDVSKLRNVKHLSGGKTTAQCPACVADGGDTKGDHLAIFADGKFACVVHPKDKEHNRTILKLSGSPTAGQPAWRLTVKPVRVEDSKVLMKVGHLGRVKPTSGQPDDKPSSAGNRSVEPPGTTECRPQRPTCVQFPVDNITVPRGLSEDITEETLREFLDLPALVA